VQWHTLSAAERAAALACRDPKARFTKQETTGIEWARWSWNPVMGCEHNCSYCYARDLALLGQAQGVLAYQVAFAPALQASRLRAPATTVVPADASDDMGWKNVFTCSMADRFGRWVPRAWIEAVLAEVRANPQWNFLFLTKFPLRYAEFEFPDNAWLGTTVDAQARIANAASSAPPWPGGSGRCAGSG
jgi:protein gp37